MGRQMEVVLEILFPPHPADPERVPRASCHGEAGERAERQEERSLAEADETDPRSERRDRDLLSHLPLPVHQWVQGVHVLLLERRLRVVLLLGGSASYRPNQGTLPLLHAPVASVNVQSDLHITLGH